MSVFSRMLRRLALAAAICALLCSLSGCDELKGDLKKGAISGRDFLLNSISRFPEGSGDANQKPEDMTLPPEFEIAPPSQPQAVGTVSEDVNIRSGPDAEYDHLGSLLAGTEVEIYHQLLLGNSPWGLTKSGWISMNYVVLSDPSLAISVPQTDNKTCLIVIPKLEVRTGPGWQYPSAEIQMEGYTTHLVKAQSGAWVQLEQGWVSRDGIYLEGSETPRTGTVTGSEVNIRSGPGTQYDRLGVVVKNQTLTVFHQVEVSDNKFWGYTSQGWISMSYVKLDKVDSETETEPENPAPKPRVGIVDPSILGEWQNAVVVGDGISLIFCGKWIFNEDGSFSFAGDDTYHSLVKTASAESEQAQKDPAASFSGLYTYDGSVLTLFCTEDPNVAEKDLPYVLLVSTTVTEDVMTMTSGDASTTLYQGTRDTVASQLLKK